MELTCSILGFASFVVVHSASIMYIGKKEVRMQIGLFKR